MVFRRNIDAVSLDMGGVNLVQKFEGFDGVQEFGFESEIRVTKIMQKLDREKSESKLTDQKEERAIESKTTKTQRCYLL